MTSSSPYPSPSEERSPRRQRKGSGAYYRVRRRSPEARESAELASELIGLAAKYPRFKPQLYKLANYVRLQMRSAHAKQLLVLGCLKEAPLSVGEIMEDTCLDKQSAMSAIGQLMQLSRLEAVQHHHNQSGSSLSVVKGDAVQKLLLANGTLNKPTYFRIPAPPANACDDEEE